MNDPHGRPQKTTVVSEAGMYRLVMRSDKPQAVRFQDWVVGTVLPSIRKHGAYIGGQETIQGSVRNIRRGCLVQG
ncbi:Bro-N domain-containing protein [Acidisphaera sp. S103]|uniref:BRO-N domain-containing protein n=1 Tax=Acidisphaera sp. S103 TaxID=1747223 RepID=UPI00352F5A3E